MCIKILSFQSKYRPIITKKRTCWWVSTVEMVQNLTHSQVPPYTSLILTCFFFSCTSLRLCHNRSHSIQERWKNWVKLILHQVNFINWSKSYLGFTSDHSSISFDQTERFFEKSKIFWWIEFCKVDNHIFEALVKLDEITVSDLGKVVGDPVKKS